MATKFLWEYELFHPELLFFFFRFLWDAKKFTISWKYLPIFDLKHAAYFRKLLNFESVQNSAYLRNLIKSECYLKNEHDCCAMIWSSYDKAAVGAKQFVCL